SRAPASRWSRTAACWWSTAGCASRRPASARGEGGQRPGRVLPLVLGERGVPEARALVQRGEAGEGLRAARRRRAHPRRELTGGLGRGGHEALPGHEAQGALVERGGPAGGPGGARAAPAAPQEPPEPERPRRAGRDRERRTRGPVPGPRHAEAEVGG